MTHTLVQITLNNDEIATEKKDLKWCFVHEGAGCRMTLCTAEVFDYGDGVAKGEIKEVKRGGITCTECISIIKRFKSVKL